MARKAAPKAETIELKRLRLRDGDILVIRVPDGALPGYRTDIMKKLSGNIQVDNVLVVFAKSLSDIKALSPEQLANVGLQRIPDAS